MPSKKSPTNTKTAADKLRDLDALDAKVKLVKGGVAKKRRRKAP